MFEIPRFDPSKINTSNRSQVESASSQTTITIGKSSSRSNNTKKRRRTTTSTTNERNGVVEETQNLSNNPNRKASSELSKSTLRVVAPEQPTTTSTTATGAASSASTTTNVKERRGLLSSRYVSGGTTCGVTEEAIDDLDWNVPQEQEPDDDEGNVAVSSSSSNTTWKEIEFAIQMSKLPILEAATILKLPNFLRDNLQRDGYEHFFPIQCLILPDVMASERRATHLRSRDVCCAAPTGSGKTLAFVIPILQALHTRILPRLSALVVLPSRDLATQVFHVFQRYSQGSDLRIGLAIGQTDFVEEQRALIIGGGGRINNHVLNKNIDASSSSSNLFFFQPTDTITSALAVFDGTNVTTPNPDNSTDNNCSSCLGGRSAVDILVCTPGRLVDHLDKTPGFTLQHLRFLVIDEADRLLNQSYQGWISRVCRAADIQSDFRFKGSAQDQNILQRADYGTSYILDPLTWRRNDESNLAYPGMVPHTTVPLRKLLFSATLTKDPQKLAACGLVHPKYYDARHLIVDKSITSGNQHQHQYSLPDLLQEFTVNCSAQQKPLVALSLILDERLTTIKNGVTSDRSEGCIVVIFTASLDSTHRLARLLQLLWARAGYGMASDIAEYSSALTQKQRDRLLKRCSDGSVAAIVCSDGMSRGMDIPAIRLVINYDIPTYAKTYVHRCGRTARAGREGKATSILSRGDEKKFLRMRVLIAKSDNVKQGGVNKSFVNEAVQAYSWCTSKLHEVIKAEKDGLDPLIPLGKEWMELDDEKSSTEDDDDSSDISYFDNDSHELIAPGKVSLF